MKTRRKQKAATTTAVAAAAAVNSSADDDEEALTTMQSHPRLVRIMKEANYEANVDPYRGIVPFFSVPFNNNNKNNEANYLDGSCGGSGGGEAIIDQSPWIECAPVLQQQQTQDAPFSWKFERMDVDGGNNSSSDKTDESNTVRVVQCGCPTIDSWAMDHWKKYQQKMKRKNKKSNNKQGKGGGGGNNDNGGSGKETKKHKDDADLDDITDRSCNGDDIECKIPILICGTSGGECCPCDFNPVRYRLLF